MPYALVTLRLQCGVIGHRLRGEFQLRVLREPLVCVEKILTTQLIGYAERWQDADIDRATVRRVGSARSEPHLRALTAKACHVLVHQLSRRQRRYSIRLSGRCSGLRHHVAHICCISLLGFAGNYGGSFHHFIGPEQPIQKSLACQ